MTTISNDFRKCFNDEDIAVWVKFLRDYQLRTDPELFAACYKSLADLKQEAVGRNDQMAAKAIWCLETVAKVQDHYITAFGRLCAGQFQEAWHHLGRCEVEAQSLTGHLIEDQEGFGVAFARAHTERFQELFPVKWGTSPELLTKEIRCSICDVLLTLRNDCGHKPGEIYNGELCHKVVSKFEVIAIALVDNPVQKATVFFPEKLDKFSPIQEVAQTLRSPWQSWNYRKEERRSHHPAFKVLGRNDECGCGSGIKYKRCCLDKETVFPHYEVYLLD